MVKFSSLNDAQKEAVVAEDKHLRIIAGAGSGKTRVLTMRIAYLIEKMGVFPKNILAITFTNKAAAEMKSRIGAMLGDDLNTVWISTIHSLCMRILREDIASMGYPKNFTVVDQNDQHQILKEAYKEYGIDKKNLSYGNVLNYIGNCKTERMSPERAMMLASGDYNEENKAKVYDYYEKRLKSIYGLDFDDLILWTVEMFSKFEMIKKKWSNRFEYIHVDEFQDIDKTQYQLIKQLSSVHDNIYVVGDPDQTIYTWRGADVNIIINFEKDFKDTRTIILNQNYRSTNMILSGANSVIKNNKLRVEKDLFTKADDGEKIVHNTLDSLENEAYYVRKEISKLYGDGTKYSNMAVLYRSNYLSRNIEKVLVEAQIPYVIYGGIRFYERAEIKDILSYLRMITQGDDLAFSRIINVPKRGIGQKTLDNILEIAKEHGITMYQVIKDGLYTKNKDVFTSFVRMIERWKEMEKTADLESLLKSVLDDSGYRMYLEKENETERLENVKALVDDIKEYSEIYESSSLDEYLQMISLYTDKENRNEVDAVSLMTIHSAKGLEFDTVFVIGMSEGVFPSERSMSDGIKGLEEERRLAYVAYTRARRKLYLTDSNDFSFVIQSSKNTSRFVNEIDDEYIEHISKVSKPVFKSNTHFFDDLENITVSKRQVAKPQSNETIKKGDHVMHAIFKEGVVIGEKNGFLEIAFAHPHGIKKILKGHPSVKKIQ
ncbi:MAG: 3'-5' exonuclease [Erysipelotrichaceae bacterium]|nr:3'-5' exonuclease [Erysipelotrichaceae bacterium]